VAATAGVAFGTPETDWALADTGTIGTALGALAWSNVGVALDKLSIAQAFQLQWTAADAAEATAILTLVKAGLGTTMAGTSTKLSAVTNKFEATAVAASVYGACPAAAAATTTTGAQTFFAGAAIVAALTALAF